MVVVMVVMVVGWSMWFGMTVVVVTWMSRHCESCIITSQDTTLPLSIVVVVVTKCPLDRSYSEYGRDDDTHHHCLGDVGMLLL